MKKCRDNSMPETPEKRAEAEAYRLLISQLDVLDKEVACTIKKFEDTGMTSMMKDDYVALHGLAHRIMEMRLKYVKESGL